MKNKGFTLVELLGVLIILSILFMVISPAVYNVITTSEETIYQKQINRILTSAYDYSLKNINILPNRGDNFFITLGQLKYEGLIDVAIKNPETNELFPDNLVISINNVGAGYKYSNKHAKLEGDYLYTVEIDSLKNSETNELLPTIILEGLTPNSNGNYIITLDLNEEFNEYSYTAKSNDEIDLTDKVVKYILKDNKIVGGIDTSKSGIYKINYSVIDENGNANISILNIIVADTILPTIIFPESSMISKDIKTFDLLNGVTCSDNSGFCDIEISGKINYGVLGKNIITYTVKDPSGNTTIKKRVITIK